MLDSKYMNGSSENSLEGNQKTSNLIFKEDYLDFDMNSNSRLDKTSKVTINSRLTQKKEVEPGKHKVLQKQKKRR